MPWKNGGGRTYEWFRRPRDGVEFDVRLSIAEVAADGPFSTFPGVDRVIVLLQGAGFRLEGPGFHDARAVIGDPLPFPGELALQCSLLAGPVFDFNVMCRRGAGLRVHVQRVDPGPLPPEGFVVALREGCFVEGRQGRRPLLPMQVGSWELSEGPQHLGGDPGAALLVRVEGPASG